MADLIDFSSAQDKKKHERQELQAKALRDRFAKAMGMTERPKAKGLKAGKRKNKRK